MKTDDIEEMSFELVRDVQSELSSVLAGLAELPHAGIHDLYLVNAANSINCAADGYIYLRASKRFAASKLLIRTVIEAIILLLAVKKQPALMLTIACNEYREERNLMTKGGKDPDKNLKQLSEKRLNAFVKEYRTKHPDCAAPPSNSKLNLEELAKLVGLDKFYDTHYRLYSAFTHAAFRSSTGELDFAGEDNRTMAICALNAVEAVSILGSRAPHLTELTERLDQITKRMGNSLIP